jgi:hypothetical protein
MSYRSTFALIWSMSKESPSPANARALLPGIFFLLLSLLAIVVYFVEHGKIHYLIVGIVGALGSGAEIASRLKKSRSAHRQRKL